MLLPNDEARLLRRNLQGSFLATPEVPLPSSQQFSSEVLQSVSDVQSSAKALPARPGQGAVKLGQEQEPLSQRNGVSRSSSVSPSNETGPVTYYSCADQTAAPPGTQACAQCSQNAEFESQQGAEQSRHEAHASKEALSGHPDAKVPTANNSKGAALACSRFHVNSLKILKRRVVAKKRKRRSISAADTEDNESAASSHEVASMTFIEPLSRQAATHIKDNQQAEAYCQQSCGQREPSRKCF